MGPPQALRVTGEGGWAGQGGVGLLSVVSSVVLALRAFLLVLAIAAFLCSIKVKAKLKKKKKSLG